MSKTVILWTLVRNKLSGTMSEGPARFRFVADSSGARNPIEVASTDVLGADRWMPSGGSSEADREEILTLALAKALSSDPHCSEPQLSKSVSTAAGGVVIIDLGVIERLRRKE